MTDTTSLNFFEIIKVKELQPDDFYLGSRTPTMLKSQDVTIILAYLPGDDESEELKDIWAALASRIAGVQFAAINGAQQTEIMKAFYVTAGDPDHPLYPFNLNGFPTILVYRKGWPQAFYNGERNFDDLEAYCLELAWRAGYYEPVNDYEGVAPSLNKLAYERRSPGRRYESDYIEQVSEKEPGATPKNDPGTMVTREQAATEVEQEAERESEDEQVIESEDFG